MIVVKDFASEFYIQSEATLDANNIGGSMETNSGVSETTHSDLFVITQQQSFCRICLSNVASKESATNYVKLSRILRTCPAGNR